MRNIPPFGLRMQPELKQRVEEAAAANGRSLNAEIVQRLEASFDAPRPPLDQKMAFLEDLIEQAISGIRRPRSEFEVDVALAAVENKLRAGLVTEKTIARRARKAAKRKTDSDDTPSSSD